MPVQISAVRQAPLIAAEPFLRIPPFPGSKVGRFSIQDPESLGPEAEIADLLRDLKVGGTFWAAQPKMPPRYFLARTTAPLDRCSEIPGKLPLVRWLRTATPTAANEARLVVTSDCDP